MAEKHHYVDEWLLLLTVLADVPEPDARQWCDARWEQMRDCDFLEHEHISWYVVPRISQLVGGIDIRTMTGAQQDEVGTFLRNFVNRYREGIDAPAQLEAKQALRGLFTHINPV